MSLSLLQSRLSLEPGLPPLKVVARSYYSSDPSESAGFVHRYLNGELDLNAKPPFAPPGSTSAAAFLDGWNTYYMKGSAASPEAERAVEDIKSTWSKALAKQSWTSWGDFHDGTYYSFNLTNAYRDGLANWVHALPYDLGRFLIPGTTWTYEALPFPYKKIVVLDCEDGTRQNWTITSKGDWISTTSEEPCNQAALDYFSENTWFIEEPERDNSDDGSHTLSFWWKVTYAVANASSARDFAVDVLGAQIRACPFPYPPNRTLGSNGAYWLEVIPGGLEFHFVESGNSTEHQVIQNYHDLHAEKTRKLTSGCLHQLLYNNVIFDVDTLDPFVQKLDSWQAPYLAVQNGNAYSLFFAFPGNEAVAIHLRSSMLTAAHARNPDEVLDNC